VAKVPSAESSNSANDDPSFAIDLNLPEFTARQVEHWPLKMSWSDAMRLFAPARERYLREFDSAEARWRDKNPARFRLF
jgi:hypothetical protein